MTQPIGVPPISNFGLITTSSIDLVSDQQLSLIDAVPIPEGTTAYVDTYRTPFVLERSNQPAFPGVRVAALNKAGYLWIRRDGAPSTWSQPAFDVSFATGNDEYDGVAGSGRPLKTLAEIGRRFRGRNLPGTELNSFQVNLLDDAPDWDYLQVHMDPNIRNAAVTCSLQGTVKIIPVGLITEHVARTPNSGAGLANAINVPLFDFSPYIGRTLRLVSTPTTSAIIERAPSLGVAELSQQSIGLGIVGVGFATGDVVEIASMSKLPGLTSMADGAQIIISDCLFDPVGTVFMNAPLSNIVLARCEVRGSGSSSNSITAKSTNFIGTSFVGKSVTITGIVNGVCFSVINGNFNIGTANFRHHWDSCGLQNSYVLVADGGCLRLHSDFYCFKLAAGWAGIYLRPNAIAYFAGYYYGSGNAAGSAGIEMSFFAKAISAVPPNMDANLGVYHDGPDGDPPPVAGGTSTPFASLPLPLTARLNAFLIS